MEALFVELPAFGRCRADYLDDDGFRALQNMMLANPDSGDVIPGTGGLRKVRHPDGRRGKGKRGGLRIIYFWWHEGSQFWLFTLYDKDEMDDLSPKERVALKDMLKREITAREKVMKRNVFAELTEGFEALKAEREGKITLRTHTVAKMATPGITPKELMRVRKSLNLSRAVFARCLRINVRTIRNWEQGRAKPNAQAALLIRLVAQYPDTVKRLAAV